MFVCVICEPHARRSLFQSPPQHCFAIIRVHNPAYTQHSSGSCLLLRGTRCDDMWNVLTFREDVERAAPGTVSAEILLGVYQKSSHITESRTWERTGVERTRACLAYWWTCYVMHSSYLVFQHTMYSIYKHANISLPSEFRDLVDSPRSYFYFTIKRHDCVVHVFALHILYADCGRLYTSTNWKRSARHREHHHHHHHSDQLQHQQQHHERYHHQRRCRPSRTWPQFEISRTSCEH